MTAVPPLLMYAGGRRPRARSEEPVPEKEHVLHIATATLLRDHCLPDWRWWHTPNGEHRDIRTAAKLKAMGVKRGVPDFILLSPARLTDGDPFLVLPHFLELKRVGEKLTIDQSEFRHWAETHCVPHAVAGTIDQVLKVFDQWHCLRIRLSPRPAE